MIVAVEMLATMSDSVFLIWFASAFLGVPILKRPHALSVPLLLMCFQLIADFYMPGFDTVYSIVTLLGWMLYIILICEKRYSKALMAVGLFWTSITLVGGGLYIVLSYWLDDSSIILQGMISDGSKVYRILYLLIAKILLFGILKLFVVLFGEKGVLSRKNNILVFVASILTYVVLSCFMNFAVEYDSKIVRFYILVGVLITVVSNIFLYFILNQLQKLLKEKYELRLMREKIDFERTRAKEVGAMWHKICDVRDDMQNHLSVISMQLKNGETDACEAYIDALFPQVESPDILIRSGNTVLDYLVNSKLGNLSDVKVRVTGYVGRLEYIEDTDIACMLGNVLDNAMEAQQSVTDEKKIELHFLIRNGYFSIVCKNTIKESVLKTNKELRSTKKDCHDHGLGHQIVQTVATKYGGFVEYFEKDGMFGVQIMLPTENRELQ